MLFVPCHKLYVLPKNMHFQSRRKIQVSTSLHNVVPVPDGQDCCTSLQTSRGVRNGNLTETGSVFPKYFASVDFLVIVFSFRLVSKS